VAGWTLHPRTYRVPWHPRRYRVYARLRLDSLFLAPLPRIMLEAAAAPMVAVVPAGDAWGVEGTLGGVGVCDRMLVGGFHAFEADARMWLTFRDNPTFPRRALPPGYVTETATRAHLSFHGIKLLVLPMAYCTIGKAGACRYPEHLSISVSVAGYVENSGPRGQFAEACSPSSTPARLASARSRQLKLRAASRLDWPRPPGWWVCSGYSAIPALIPHRSPGRGCCGGAPSCAAATRPDGATSSRLGLATRRTSASCRPTR